MKRKPRTWEEKWKSCHTCKFEGKKKCIYFRRLRESDGKEQCVMCGKIATHYCASASSLVCGTPLCKKCKCPTHDCHGSETKWEDSNKGD